MIRRPAILIVLLISTALPVCTSADDATLKELTVYPSELTLRSLRHSSRLIVTAQTEDGTTFDATGLTTIKSERPEIAEVINGRIQPGTNGTTTIRLKHGDVEAAMSVTVHLTDVNPVSLRNEVLPVLSKQGCSSGACHGSPQGKGGFRLSLRAFDPSIDEITLRSEFFGRRVNSLNPDTSILLRKPLTDLPHAGGQRLTKGSISHQVLRRWISEGTRLDSPDTPQCESIELFPPSGRELNSRYPTQSFVVLARYSDGSTRDVTDLAVFTSSDSSAVVVDEAGEATRVEKSRGQAAITVRYLEHMATSDVVSVADIDNYTWPSPPEANYVDELVHRKLRQLKYAPSSRSTDSEFIRRVTLDVTGLLPTPDETQAFLGDTLTDKRARLIDRLLASGEHAKFMALKWGDALRIRSASVSSPGVFKYHRWLVRAFAQNMPYDEFARQLLTASGSTFENPPANWFRTAGNTNDCTESTAQVFLGTRLECAKCHNHPHERWTQDNYYGLAAFFNRVQRDTTDRKDELFISVVDQGEIEQPRTGQQMQPWLPGTGTVETESSTDRRLVLADWLTTDDNPFFARVEVNRLWSQLTGRGIVEPIDDFRDSNPPSNAELLDALAADFVAHNFDRRHILRTILNSETYQRSSEALPQNEDDDRYFSRYPRRLLSAEQLLDAICDVTGVSESFSGMPAGTRATQLPSPDFGKEFLKVFGQPERKSVCRCERSNDLNLSQALQISNGSYVHGKLTNGNNTVRRLLKENRPPEEIVDSCYLAAFSRPATEAEIQQFQAFMKRRPDRPLDEAFEDLQWALLNSNEFLFQH